MVGYHESIEIGHWKSQTTYGDLRTGFESPFMTCLTHWFDLRIINRRDLRTERQLTEVARYHQANIIETINLLL